MGFTKTEAEEKIGKQVRVCKDDFSDGVEKGTTGKVVDARPLPPSEGGKKFEGDEAARKDIPSDDGKEYGVDIELDDGSNLPNVTKEEYEEFLREI